MIVSGSAIVKNPNPKDIIQKLKDSVTKWIDINSKGI